MDLQTVLEDPDFHGLPVNERRKVLLTVDPDFAQLPAPEQDKAILGLEQRFAKPAQIPTRAMSTHIPQSPEMQLQAAHTKMQATADEYKPSGYVRPTLEGLGTTIGTLAGVPAPPGAPAPRRLRISSTGICCR